jgi:hypothetical protein
LSFANTRLRASPKTLPTQFNESPAGRKTARGFWFWQQAPNHALLPLLETFTVCP